MRLTVWGFFSRCRTDGKITLCEKQLPRGAWNFSELQQFKNSYYHGGSSWKTWSMQGSRALVSDHVEEESYRAFDPDLIGCVELS